MRFYRIVDDGPDTTSDEPVVSITSPASGATAAGELTITVVASTDQPVLTGTKLYVDGQEMQRADRTTNYMDSTGVTNYEMDTYSINTCEWGNETHTLFATTECQSGYGDVINSGPIYSGHGVSSFVPVIFNNLITRISFSQPSFDPSSGQTQQIGAVFAANSDWQLNIVDVYSNVVATATGSGTTMSYGWDGNGIGETGLPNGIYYYYLSAATNGASSDIVVNGSGGSGGGSPPSPDFVSASLAGSDSSQLWTVPTNSSGNVTPIPLALYPPGFNTNSLIIFEASDAEIASLRPSPPQTLSMGFRSMGVCADDGSSSAPAPAAQTAPPAPQRPPNNPVRGLAGTFGVAYNTYTANGPGGFSIPPLANGLGYHGEYISLAGMSADQGTIAPSTSANGWEAKNFSARMQHWGWTNALFKGDNQLNISDLIGSGSPFNNVNLGVFIGHGIYGSSLDYTANECKQMYFPVTSGSSAQYLRMSQMNLGGPGANGLKWFAMLACYSLYQQNWQNMQYLGVHPYNNNLQLLLGATTKSYSNGILLLSWADYMNYGNSSNYNPMTIRAAWYQAARSAYANDLFPSGTVVKFVVTGDSACQNDTLQSTNPPSGNWFYDAPVQVYP